MHTLLIPAASRAADVVSVALRGAVTNLRPLESSEHAALDAVFEGLSPASRIDRYLTGMPHLTAPMRSALTAIDGYHGRRLGTALLDTLMTVASVSGVDKVQGTVVPTNLRLLPLLRANGVPTTGWLAVDPGRV
jgi:hypothetical protein